MDLRKLREIVEMATPGPWRTGFRSGQCRMDHAHGRGDCVYEPVWYDGDSLFGQYVSTTSGEAVVVCDDSAKMRPCRGDAELIAHLRNHAEALLDVVEAAERLLDALEPHAISEEYELVAALARVKEIE